MLADAQRLSTLQAIGIDVFRLRAMPAANVIGESAIEPARVVVVCRSDAVPRRFLAQLPSALGIPPGCVLCCEPGAAVPEEAAAYVVIGTEAARALGVQLSTMQQTTSMIAATAEPAALLQGATAKRALWQSLKPVARRLRGYA